MRHQGTVLASAVIAGALTGVATDVRAWDGAAVAIAAATLALVGRVPRLRSGLACLGLFAATCSWSAAARDHAVRPPLLTWFDSVAGAADRPAGLVTVDGILAADAVSATGGVRLVIDVRAVDDGAGWREARGRLQAHVAGDLAAGRIRDWTAGRPVRAPVALRRPALLLNFGAPSLRWQVLRRPFVLVGSIKSAMVVQVEAARWWDERAAAIRWRVRDAVSRFVGPQAPDARAIVTAILIGDRAGLSDEVERRLQDAGTFHVIAISGGNVAVLTVLCFGLLRLVLRSYRVVAGGTLAAIVVYGWIVGGEPSVARAVTAASIYLALGVIGLRPSPLAALRAAAVALVLVDPLTVLDTGAWLSFAATFGIIVFARGWTRRWEAGPSRVGVLWTGLKWCGFLTAATIAAEIMLLPIAASAFSRVSVAGLLLNVIAIPAMAVVQLAGLATVLMASVAPIVSATAASVATAAANGLLSSCALVDVLPWLSWRVPPSSLWWILAYYVSLGVATLVHIGVWRRLAIGAAALTLGVILIAPGVGSQSPRGGRLRLTIVDVGQGDAILLQTPDGHALLIDAGGTTGSFDIGGRVVTPALWALGVRSLDWLALSHGDRDHVGGSAAVVRDLAPREIWEAVPVPRDPERAQLRELARDRRLSWRTVQAGARVELRDVTLDAIHPPPPEWERQKVRNDDSLVLRVRYGNVEIWLTGDAGSEFESRLADDAAEARVRILKVGHHGSRTATSARLVAAFRPQIAIVSAGRGNLFGHPSPDVLARLTDGGATVFRTDRDGAIVIETDGVVARVRAATGRSWLVAAFAS